MTAISNVIIAINHCHQASSRVISSTIQLIIFSNITTFTMFFLQSPLFSFSSHTFAVRVNFYIKLFFRHCHHGYYNKSNEQSNGHNLFIRISITHENTFPLKDFFSNLLYTFTREIIIEAA